MVLGWFLCAHMHYARSGRNVPQTLPGTKQKAVLKVVSNKKNPEEMHFKSALSQ